MTRARALALAALALVLAVAWVYAPVAGHDFLRYDDPDYLLDNPHVAGGLRAREVGWAFTHAHAANYHPLTWVSHMLDVELFGLEPGPHHLVSAAWHALAAVLALLVLEALLGSVPAAALGAALFALHPLRVESVAWASERKDVLCTVFFLAALAARLARRARASSGRPARGWLGLELACFVAALLAKPMAVTYPLVAALLDLFPAGARGDPGAARVDRRWILERGTLFGLAGAAALVTLVAQAQAGSTSSLGGLGLDLRLLNALRSLAVYLGQSLWPRALSVFYPHAAILAEDPRAALLPGALAGLALLVAGSVLALRLRRRVPALGLGLGFALATLLPVLGLVQVGTQAHADRYTYLPSLGLSLALAGAALALGPRVRRLAAGAGLVAALLLATGARAQVARWRDTGTLFRHALAVEPRNYLAHTMLGERALAEGREPEARAAFLQALAIHPDDVLALNKLALCHLATGELELARRRLERALTLAPGDFDTSLNLGVVELERGSLAAARLRFEECLRRAPERPEVHIDLGLLAQREGRPEQAEASFREAVRLDPEHPEAWSHLGQSELAAGRTGPARAAFARVVALAPEDPIAHFNLGVAAAKDGDPGAARACYRQALTLDPELEFARAALAALDTGGSPGEE